MLWLVNPLGILIVLLSLGLSVLIYRGYGTKKERVLSIGSLTRNINVIIAFAYPVYYLGYTNDVEFFGSGVALSLYLVVFGTFVDVVCKLLARYKN